MCILYEHGGFIYKMMASIQLHAADFVSTEIVFVIAECYLIESAEFLLDYNFSPCLFGKKVKQTSMSFSSVGIPTEPIDAHS